MLGIINKEGVINGNFDKSPLRRRGSPTVTNLAICQILKIKSLVFSTLFLESSHC